jgi:hypothetical protein
MTVNTLQGSADFDTKQSCAVLCTSKMFAQPTNVKAHDSNADCGLVASQGISGVSDETGSRCYPGEEMVPGQ